jgi:excisionase family DNA binding protein
MTAPRRNESRWGRLLRRKEAAAYLGVGQATFDALVRTGEIPPPKQFIGAKINVWDIVDLDGVADDLTTDATSEPDHSWD